MRQAHARRAKRWSEPSDLSREPSLARARKRMPVFGLETTRGDAECRIMNANCKPNNKYKSWAAVQSSSAQVSGQRQTPTPPSIAVSAFGLQSRASIVRAHLCTYTERVRVFDSLLHFQTQRQATNKHTEQQQRQGEGRREGPTESRTTAVERKQGYD